VHLAERQLPEALPAVPKPDRPPEEVRKLPPPPEPSPRPEAEPPAPTSPRLLSQGHVAYPRQALLNPNNPNLTKTVTVVVLVQVDARGQVQDVTVLQGVPGGYDGAALEAMRGSTFAPATKDGQPVAGNLQVRVSFQRVR
jgi:protein TonB